MKKRQTWTLWGVLLTAVTSLAAVTGITTQVTDVQPVPIQEGYRTAAQDRQEMQQRLSATPQSLPSQDDFAAMAPLIDREGVTYGSIDDLCGDWVANWESTTVYNSLGTISGGSVTLSPIAGTDSVVISNFWYPGSSLKGVVDLTNRQILIPRQRLVEINGAPYVIVPWLLADTHVMLDINDDGTLGGYCVIDGRGYKMLFERANGKLHATQLVPADGTATRVDVDYNVVVAQPYNNLVRVKNFANMGQTVDIEFDGNGNGKMANQLCGLNGAYTEFAVYVASFNESTGQPLTYSRVLPVQLDADDATALTVSTWMPYCEWYYRREIHLDTRITSEVEVQITAAHPTLDGEGTAQSPYLISTPDDLMELAAQVNGVTTTNATDADGTAYAQVFADTHFALANDIDMTGYRFIPIGRGAGARFAGTFDGQGHTISNLNVSTEYMGYAGLFGYADQAAVIQNLTLDRPVIRSRADYAGAVVARFPGGTLANCHVTGGDIEVTGAGDSNFYLSPGRYVGGMAGAVGQVSHCTISDSRVSGFGGYVGGLAAVVNGIAEYCEATDMNVLANYQNIYDNLWYEIGGMGDYRPSGGLFAYLNDASATDCCFSGVMGTHDNEVNRTALDKIYSESHNPYQQSWQHLGGIAGRLDNGVITRCFVVGRVYRGDASGARIEDWTSLASGLRFDIYGDETGGLVGLLNGELSDCYLAGDVFVKGYDSGCLVAAARQGATISNCFATVQQDQPFAVYALRDGQHPLLSAAPTVSHVYYDSQIMRMDSVAWYTADQATGLSTAQMTGAQGFGLTGDEWVYREGFYPVLRGFENHPVANWGATAILAPEGEALHHLATAATIHALPGVSVTCQGRATSIDNDNLVASGLGNDTVWVSNGKSSFYYVVLSMGSVQLEGEGTADSPFLIQTKEDWLALSNASGKSDFAGVYFKMTNDIDLEDTDEIYMIGRYPQNKFAGNFNGDNHAIHGVKGRSLFYLVTETGVVRNLVMAEDNSLTDAPFCYENHGLIEHCINYADALSSGIVGQNSGTVRLCANLGNIGSQVWSAAGIGFGTGLFEQCVNIGSIYITRTDSESHAYGIGRISAGEVHDCVNLGEVSAMNAYGVYLLESATGQHLINAGRLLGTHHCYGLSNDNSTISGGYWDGQISLTANTEGWTETAQLTDGQVLEGFDPEVWSFEPGMYPVLKWCADLPQVQHARRSVLTLPTGITVDDITADGELAQHEGLTWSLVRGTDFTIEGNVLKSPAPRMAEITDTLVATWADYTRRIPIKRHLAFAQAGTAEDPYLINNADEWNSLATYKNNNNVDFAGKVLKVTADIDFTDHEFVAWQGTFNGTLLGNGKSLTGIHATTTYVGWAVCGSVGSDGVVQDLTLEGDVVCGKNSASAFAFTCSGLVENCVNHMNLTATETANITNISGIVGLLTGGTVARCVNYGNIKGYQRLGGITFMASSGGIVIDCANYGDITGVSLMGGIVADSRTAIIAECVNRGRITSQQGIVGGIVGDTPTTQKTELVDCLNAGDVSTLANAQFNPTGGIVGRYNVSMTRCVNTGKVDGYSFVGGLAGWPSSSQFDDCYSTGQVIAKANLNAGGGGNLFGVTENSNQWGSCTATNCYYVTDNMIDGVDASYTNGLSLAELCAMDMNADAGGGSDWQNYDNYSLPMPATIAGWDVVKAVAAEVILAEGDTRNHVTQNFNVGLPEGATWTATPRVVNFVGNRANLFGSCHDSVDMTVTVADFCKTISLLMDFDDPMDVTGDGVVDIADVNAVINVMLGKAVTSDELLVTSDVTGDGVVDIADVNAVINAMLGK